MHYVTGNEGADLCVVSRSLRLIWILYLSFMNKQTTLPNTFKASAGGIKIDITLHLEHSSGSL
jgi:hypothetical protein